MSHKALRFYVNGGTAGRVDGIVFKMNYRVAALADDEQPGGVLGDSKLVLSKCR
jgi:hypothetical protein